MRKKIGILGGTFDPFHKGHFMMAESAHKQFDLDEVWIMPNGNPPHKRNQEKTEFHIRCEMVQLAIADAPYMQLCSVEGSDDCYHYTYQTLGQFKTQFPEYELYFIIGADSLYDFPKWRKPEEISKLCTLLVACRDEAGISELEEQAAQIHDALGTQIHVMQSPRVDAASSEIRKMIAKDMDVSAYLHEAVYEYIQKEQLYKVL